MEETADGVGNCEDVEGQPQGVVRTGVGLLAGVLASLFGIGGGILITPFLNILGAPMPLAVATATPVIAVNASMATVIGMDRAALVWLVGTGVALVFLAIRGCRPASGDGVG